MNPVIPGVVGPQLLLAADQPQYQAVVAVVTNHRLYPVVEGLVPSPTPGLLMKTSMNGLLLCFRPSSEERDRIYFDGQDIYVNMLTFGQGIQPIMMLVGAQEAAAAFNLEVAK